MATIYDVPDPEARPRVEPIRGLPPELIDFATAVSLAKERRQHFLNIIAHAEVEVAKCDAWLGQERKVPRGSKPRGGVLDITYRVTLTALGGHAYACRNTLAQEARVSTSTVGYVMTDALKRGHVTVELGRRRRHTYRLTEAGMDYLTRSAT